MRKVWLAFALGAVLAAWSPAQAATTLWYNGDAQSPDPGNAGNSEIQTGVPNGQGGFENELGVEFEDFIVPAGQTWTVTDVFETAAFSYTPASTGTAEWEILSGSSVGDPGTVVAGSNGTTLFTGNNDTPGASTCTITATGDGTIEESLGYTVMISGLNVTLSAGQYWVAMAPLDAFPTQSSVLALTTGANAVNPSYSDSDDSFQYSYVSGTPTFEAQPQNYSMGVDGTESPAGVVTPEPISMIFFATGLVAVAGYAARRKNR